MHPIRALAFLHPRKARTATIKLIIQVLIFKSQLRHRQSLQLVQHVTQLYAYSPDRHITKTVCLGYLVKLGWMLHSRALSILF